MIIRVDSIVNLTADVAACIHTPINQMLHDIHSINFETDDKRGLGYIVSRKREKLTSVYLCHLTRRLNRSDGKLLLPLDELLFTQNVFSDFLREHDISFQKDLDGEIALFYHKQKIDWKNNKSKGFNPYRLSNRLHQDFCVNGFQFLYDINANTGSSYDSYMGVPEFIRDLEDLLNIGLVQEYRKNSQGYVALCKISSNNVVFDSKLENCDFDVQYLNSALQFIWEYCYGVSISESIPNPILRAKDNNKVCIERLIKEKDIPRRL